MTTAPTQAPQPAADAAPAGTARLSCSGVTVRFGGLVALDDVELVVPPATTVGLVGPNGAGKSTLFGVLSGLLRPNRGQVLLDGVDVTKASPQQRAVRGLSRTFQHPEVFGSLTVRENLVLAYRAKHERSRVWSDLVTMGGVRRAPRPERIEVDRLLALVGLSDLADRPAIGLPLGMARRLELARALAAGPSVLLLDEPSSGLDSAETEQFENVLRTVTTERGISCLLVEHDVDLVMRMSSSVYVLDFGRLIASGPPEQVRSDPAVRAAYLGEESAEVAVELAEEMGAEVKQARAAAAAGKAARAAADPTSDVLLSVRDLSVRYGDATALTGVSFEVGRGRALAVLGVNGAGKSSLARALAGLVPASTGTVHLDGQNITSHRAHRIRRQGLLYLPEGRAIFPQLTVSENVRMAAAPLGGRQTKRDAVQLAFEIFPVLGERRNQTAGLLSGGEQQMLSLARALATGPTLVIADEMSLGLAPKMVDAVFEGLVRARESGMTVIMIEQYVHRALDFADDCLVLQRGEVTWQGPAAGARGEVLRHYLGEAMTADT